MTSEHIGGVSLRFVESDDSALCVIIHVGDRVAVAANAAYRGSGVVAHAMRHIERGIDAVQVCGPGCTGP